ncbi:MAG: hypothetical protein IPG45_07670 [Deltaproteobacteria bacterium]|jgi:hypothetical protein|nr:hypothetical protein [Deltaproteobacteria bacterium]
MAPEVARTLFIAGFCLLVGAAGGSLATRALYGDGGGVVVPTPPTRPECPICKECPACPPPPDCGDLGVVPTETPPPTILGEDGPTPEAKPGLPASVIKPAGTAVEVLIEPCLTAKEAEGLSGTVVLDLTVTATGGQGFISEVLITRRVGAVESVEPCLSDAAKRARFEWSEGEGELKFKLPVKVGR